MWQIIDPFSQVVTELGPAQLSLFLFVIQFSQQSWFELPEGHKMEDNFIAVNIKSEHTTTF